MLGPPRLTKLLFEAHLLRLALKTIKAVSMSSPESVARQLGELIRNNPNVANDIVAIGIPILLGSREIVRGPQIIVPADAQDEPVTSEQLEKWVHDGWVDLRRSNCAKWIERCQRIHDEIGAIPRTDTSSRYLRNRRFWQEDDDLEPGKIAGWILEVEEHGNRIKA
jgi:hypothetical protein